MEKEENGLKINWKMGVIFVLGLAFVVLGCILLKRINSEDLYEGKFIVIDNLSQSAKKITAGESKQVYFQLYEAVSQNLPEDQLIPRKGAKVRKESVKLSKNNSNEQYSFSALVDIEEISQSYRVVFNYNNGDNDRVDINVYCPLEKELIYGDFGCELEFSQNDTERLQSLLPIRQDADEDDALPLGWNGSFNAKTNRFEFNYCAAGDSNAMAALEASVEDFLEENYIDLEKIEVAYMDSCK